MDKKFQELIAKANQGDLSAQWELAIAYFEGEVNGEAQISEGCKYLDIAANSGNSEVKCLCANVYKAAGFHSIALDGMKKLRHKDTQKAKQCWRIIIFRAEQERRMTLKLYIGRKKHITQENIRNLV